MEFWSRSEWQDSYWHWDSLLLTKTSVSAWKSFQSYGWKVISSGWSSGAELQSGQANKLPIVIPIPCGVSGSIVLFCPGLLLHRGLGGGTELNWVALEGQKAMAEVSRSTFLVRPTSAPA